MRITERQLKGIDKLASKVESPSVRKTIIGALLIVLAALFLLQAGYYSSSVKNKTAEIQTIQIRIKECESRKKSVANTNGVTSEYAQSVIDHNLEMARQLLDQAIAAYQKKLKQNKEDIKKEMAFANIMLVSGVVSAVIGLVLVLFHVRKIEKKNEDHQKSSRKIQT